MFSDAQIGIRDTTPRCMPTATKKTDLERGGTFQHYRTVTLIYAAFIAKGWALLMR
jgi:hypothetical protein